MFKEYKIDDKEQIESHVLKLNYKEHNLSFTNMYLWKDKFELKVYACDDFIIILSHYHDEIFSINPICTYDNVKKAIDFLINYFEENKLPFKINNCVKIVRELIEAEYPEYFEYTTDRDAYDYLYSIDKMVTFSGKKLQKKRNHINNFKKNYADRYEIKFIDNEEVINDCIAYTQEWALNKEVKDEYLPAEVSGTIDVLTNFNQLSCEGLAVYIDGKVQGYGVGTQLNDTTAVINIEKANPEIIGLYPFVRQQVVSNFFDDLTYLNTEDDIGDENLRKSKLSYYPEYLVEKYNITRVNDPYTPKED